MSASRTRWAPRGPLTMASAGAESKLPVARKEEQRNNIDAKGRRLNQTVDTYSCTRRS